MRSATRNQDAVDALHERGFEPVGCADKGWLGREEI